MNVPFFRPSISQADIAEVVACMESGWLTTGPRTKAFEEAFAHYVGAKHAIALNSCTAALHLALEAVGVRRGDLVLVPALTFAATAEVVRYFDAIPVFVDADPVTLCMDPVAAANTAAAIRRGERLPGMTLPYGPMKAIIPMHYGGQMVDVDAIAAVAREHGLAIIDDAAHTLPAHYRAGADQPWRAVGSTADVTCFSFYANKCITTGEGGMAVTNRDDLAERMRIMSLHGMSKDAWKRFSSKGSWYYEIVAPGFKYNMTDVAAALGVAQLARADELLAARASVAQRFIAGLEDVPEVDAPTELPDRRHSWHLFSVQLRLDRLTITRSQFIEEMKARGVAASVHWLPLHMQPYYIQTYGYAASDFPVAAGIWPRLVSLPIFPAMTDEEVDHVIGVVREVARQHSAPAKKG